MPSYYSSLVLFFIPSDRMGFEQACGHLCFRPWPCGKGTRHTAGTSTHVLASEAQAMSYVSIRQHTSAQASIRQHTSEYVLLQKLQSYPFFTRYAPLCTEIRMLEDDQERNCKLVILRTKVCVFRGGACLLLCLASTLDITCTILPIIKAYSAGTVPSRARV